MTEYPYVRAAFINVIAEEGTKEEAVSYLQKQWNENCALRAEIERLKEQGPPHEYLAKILAQVAAQKRLAEKAEAERDAARAQVAAAYDVAAERLRMEEGTFIASRVINAVKGLTPADAKAALEAYGRKKVWEGMKHMLNRLQHEGHVNPSLTYADAIEWAEYVLNEMEKDADQ